MTIRCTNYYYLNQFILYNFFQLLQFAFFFIPFTFFCPIFILPCTQHNSNGFHYTFVLPLMLNFMVDLYGTLDPFEKKLIKLNLENKEMKNENDNWIYKLLLFESIYIIQFFSQLLQCLFSFFLPYTFSSSIQLFDYRIHNTTITIITMQTV